MPEKISDCGRKAGGIQTYGTTTIAVIAASGQSININFSRPTAVPVYVKVTNLETGSDFPLNGADLVKAAIIDYIGGAAYGGLPIGRDVVYMDLPGVIKTVTGVIDFDLEIGESASSYGTDNITIDTREKAVTDEGKVTVE